MDKIPQPALAGNNTLLPDGLPLFDWAKHCPAEHFQSPNLPLPVRAIARRFGFEPHLARVLAEHAGFKLNEVTHG